MAESQDTSGFHEPLPARTLGSIVEHVNALDSVRKGDLESGDWVVVTTKNSRYTICFLGSEIYAISGGWFDLQQVSPVQLSINGCTWGGSAIKHDILAARGLFLEFGNRVRTTRIQKVQVYRSGELPLSN
jgi:hypothetical protein